MDKIVRKAKQLNTVIQDIKDGTLKLNGIDPKDIHTFRPLIITMSHFPIWNFTWFDVPPFVGMATRLKQNNYLTESDVATLKIVNVSELEFAGTIQRAGSDLFQIIREWSASVPITNSLNNHFIEKGAINRNNKRSNEIMSNAWDIAVEVLKLRDV